MNCKGEGRRKPFVSLLRTALDKNIRMCWGKGIPDDDGEGVGWGKVRAWSLHPCGKFFEAWVLKKCCTEINDSGVYLENWAWFSDASTHGSIAHVLGKLGNHWTVKPEGRAWILSCKKTDIIGGLGQARIIFFFKNVTLCQQLLWQIALGNCQRLGSVSVHLGRHMPSWEDISYERVGWRGRFHTSSCP